jgi:hypothetical protein
MDCCYHFYYFTHTHSSLVWGGPFDAGKEGNDYAVLLHEIQEVIATLKVFLEMDANVVFLSLASLLGSCCTVNNVPVPVVFKSLPFQSLILFLDHCTRPTSPSLRSLLSNYFRHQTVSFFSISISLNL